MKQSKNNKVHHILILLILLIVFVIIFYNSRDKYEPEPVKVVDIEKQETISFYAKDSLEITADLYLVHDFKAPFIILFHQAGWSRGEYKEIAPKLNSMGFNCMAIDQRSGDEVNGVFNQTFNRAEEKGLPTTYLDAYPDMEAALKYVKENYAEGKLIIWGSSYSASLVIKLASENSKIVDGILSFAPGEYFEKVGKSKRFISEAAKKITCPIFITSAKAEKPRWEMIYQSVQSEYKYSFIPETEGNHGSRALWDQFEDSKVYWNEVNVFLKKYFIE